MAINIRIMRGGLKPPAPKPQAAWNFGAPSTPLTNEETGVNTDPSTAGTTGHYLGFIYDSWEPLGEDGSAGAKFTFVTQWVDHILTVQNVYHHVPRRTGPRVLARRIYRIQFGPSSEYGEVTYRDHAHVIASLRACGVQMAQPAQTSPAITTPPETIEPPLRLDTDENGEYAVSRYMGFIISGGSVNSDGITVQFHTNRGDTVTLIQRSNFQDITTLNLVSGQREVTQRILTSCHYEITLTCAGGGSLPQGHVEVFRANHAQEIPGILRALRVPQ